MEFSGDVKKIKKPPYKNGYECLRNEMKMTPDIKMGYKAFKQRVNDRWAAMTDREKDTYNSRAHEDCWHYMKLKGDVVLVRMHKNLFELLQASKVYKKGTDWKRIHVHGAGDDDETVEMKRAAMELFPTGGDFTIIFDLKG